MATNEDFLQVIDKMLTDFVDNLSFVSTPKQVKEQFKKTFEPALKKLIKSNKALKVSAERVISERDLYIKLRKDFEKKQAAFEHEKRRHEAKYTEIDKLRGELKAAHQKNAALEMGGCLNFCVRGAERLVHGGGRRLRRTDRRGGQVGATS